MKCFVDPHLYRPTAILTLISLYFAQTNGIKYLQPNEAAELVLEHQLVTKELEKSGYYDAINQYLAHPDLLLAALKSGNGVSEICSDQVVYMFEGLYQRSSWALQMLDAFGKPGPGLLSAKFNWIGDFDECMAIKSVKNASQPSSLSFRAKYCSGGSNLPSTQILPQFSLGFGMCLPEGCSNADVSSLLKSLGDLLGSRNISFPSEALCQEHDVKLSSPANAAISVYSVIAALCLLATLYDVVSTARYQAAVRGLDGDTDPLIAEPSTTEPSMENGDVSLINPYERKPPVLERGVFGELLMCFSLYTNGCKLLSGKKVAGSLDCLHGIRFISMTWVVLGHTLVFALQTISNLAAVLGWAKTRWSFQLVVNATISVDSFFLISGLLSVYLMLKNFEKNKPSFKRFIISVPIAYLHRYIRLTPAYGLMILFWTTVTLYFYEGPLRPGGTFADVNCVNHSVFNLLYVNNVVQPNYMCAAWTWYLANDFQFSLLAPFIAYIMYRSKLAGGVISSFLVLVSVGSAIGVSIYYDLGFSTLDTRDPKTPVPSEIGNYNSEYYMAPWSRYQSYGVGTFFALILWMCKGKLPVGRVVNLALWVASAAVMLAYLFGTTDLYSRGHTGSKAEIGMYNGVGRMAWSISLGYIILACCTGYGGWVNELLSWPGFIPLSRMTYCTYLVHPVVISLLSAAHHTLDTWTVYSFATSYVGNLTLSFAIGFIFSLLFEAPFMNLDKKYITGKLSKKNN